MKGCLNSLQEGMAAEWTAEQVEELIKICADILDAVRGREGRYDENMVKGYLKRKKLANIDVRFCFVEGDEVLRLARRNTKLCPRVWGPYVFLQYGPSHTTADIKDV